MNGRLILGVLAAGSVSGLFFSLVQQLDSLPLLFSAEAIDAATSTDNHTHSGDGDPPHDHAIRATARLLSDILAAIGYAALISASIYAHNHAFPRHKAAPVAGILWGMAGYLAFYLVPSLSFPPRTPASDVLHGAAADGIGFVQLRWLLLAIATAAGLVLLVYGKRGQRLLGAALIVCPVLAGLMQDTGGGVSPSHPGTSRLITLTEQHYRYAASISNLLFWLFLGVACAFTTGRVNSQNPTTDPEPESQPDERLTTQQ